jgi:hypothetical protein
MKPKFKLYQKIRHVKTGGEYMITQTPDPQCLLEATGSMFYVYQGQGAITEPTISWIREQGEMEDGRFIKCEVTE